MIRRRMLLAAALCAPAIARAQPLAATVLVPSGFGADVLELTNARAGGHFAAAGLDATLRSAAGTVGAMQQLVAGRAQLIRAGAVDVMQAVAMHRLPIVAIATIVQGSSFRLISAAARPLAGAADLRGRRIGIVSAGGTSETLLDLILSQAGIPHAATAREVVGNSPSAFALVEQGRIDGFIASAAVAGALRRSGAALEAWSTDRFAPMPGQCIFTTEGVIAARPELVIAFLRGLKASVLEILRGPVEPLLVRAATGFDIPGLRDRPALLAAIEADHIPLWLGEGRENLLLNVPRLWSAGAATLAAAELARIADPAALYTNRFIAPVMAEG